MSSPYPIATLLGALLFLLRHQPESSRDQTALVSAIRTALDGADLVLTAEPESLSVNGAAVAREAPGAALLNEQLLVHGLRRAQVPGDFGDAELLRLVGVLAAYPGAYVSFEQVRLALGPAASRISLTRGAEDFELYQASPDFPSADSETTRLDLPEIRRDDAAELQPTLPAPPTKPSLDRVLRSGREAIEREDWGGLLEAALQLLEAESEAPTEISGSTYRIELKRLMSRRHLEMIARLAHGERRDDAIALLRRCGAASTEILMELLVEAMTLGERRGYFSAITQMRDGTDAIIHHLAHQEWYVVRNAAELCGEMRLAAAVPQLARQTGHPDERVRKAVAEALAQIATPLAFEPLRKLLADSALAVRLNAVAHLGGRRAGGMTRALAELLRRDENAELQHETLLALGRIGSVEAIEVLREFAAPGGRVMGRRPVGVRVTAVNALGLAGPAAVDALAALEQDDLPEVRAAAQAALAPHRA